VIKIFTDGMAAIWAVIGVSFLIAFVYVLFCDLSIEDIREKRVDSTTEIVLSRLA
jgi:Na+/proline symporter